MRALLGGLLVLTACFSKPGFSGDAGTGGDGSVVPPTPVSSSLSAGTAHACQIDAQHHLWCWGSNAHGQLGPQANAASSSATPLAVDAAASWDWVSAGSDHTCGVTAGKVMCWGANDLGQSAPVADTNDQPYGTPVLLPNSETAKRVFAGDKATCAIAESGATYCWGDLDFDGTNRQPIRRLTASDLFVQVALGPDHACAIRDFGNGVGTAVCWGQNDHLQLGSMVAGLSFDQATAIDNGSRTFGSIAAGTTATCGTTVENELVCFGSNQFGQLGTAVSGDTRDVVVDATNPWVSVTMRDQQTCAVTKDGEVHCFGDAASGALGRGAYRGERTIGPAVLTAASAITTGDEFTCARSTQDTSMGDVWCWGVNDVGQLGNKKVALHELPVEVTLPIGQNDFVHHIVAGDDHTCALAGPSGGELYAYCWGRNDKRQVTNGNNTAQPDVFTTPVKVMSPMDLSGISAGAEHTCAIQADGTIYCWGSNAFGQLGRANTSMNGDNTLPGPTSGGNWETIAAGNQVSCAINTAGELFCWGAVFGESAPFTSPHKYGLSGTWTWRQLAIGTGAIIGVATDPALSNRKHITGWGDKCQEDQRNATMDPTAVTQQVILEATDYTGINLAVAGAQGGHACALTKHSGAANAALACWGLNSAMQVDNGSTTDCHGDTAIALPSGGVQWHLPDTEYQLVTAAANHTCALGNDNVAYCWGSAKDQILAGQPADGLPKPIGNQRWSELATGATHACGVDDLNKHVLCWGQGKYGQLGDGSRFYPFPTPGGLIP